MSSRKKAKSLKEKAKKDHEKSQKQYQKRQSKAELLAEKELKKLAKEWEHGYNEEASTMPHRPSTVLMALKQKMTRSNSQGMVNTIFNNKKIRTPYCVKETNKKLNFIILISKLFTLGLGSRLFVTSK